MSIDSKARKANYYAALKALASGPREIEQARAQYDADMGYVREMEGKRIWAPLAIDRMKAQAQSKRDDAIRKAVDRMRPAVETVQAERSAPGEMLDIDNAQLQRAITVCNTMGRKLNPSDQIAIIEKFRGDTASLRFVADLFDKYGLYYADYARQLTTPVSSEAIQNIAVEIGRYDNFGKFETDNLRWTNNEFSKALERNGVNSNEDPFVAAAIEMKHAHRDDPSAQQSMGSAIAAMRKAQEEGRDDAATMGEILNSAMETWKTMMEADE